MKVKMNKNLVNKYNRAAEKRDFIREVKELPPPKLLPLRPPPPIQRDMLR
jgi:hypothetical protein